MGYLFYILFCFIHSQPTIVVSVDNEVAELAYVSKEDVSNKKALANLLIKEAKRLRGTKYKFGGQSERGMDCSGLVSHLYSQIHIKLPRSASLQVNQGKMVGLNELIPGDLIFFKHQKKVSHVAMVVHQNKNQLIIVHSTSSKGVIFEDLNSSAYWKDKFFVAKRLI